MRCSASSRISIDRALAALVGVADDLGGCVDQAAQQRALAHNACVIFNVSRGGHGIEQLAQVLDPADGLQLIRLVQLFPERHRIDYLPVLEEPAHGAEDATVRLPVEHRVVDDLDGLGHRIAIDEHAAQHADLRFRRPGWLPFGDGDAVLRRAHRAPNAAAEVGPRRAHHVRAAQQEGGMITDDHAGSRDRRAPVRAAGQWLRHAAAAPAPRSGPRPAAPAVQWSFSCACRNNRLHASISAGSGLRLLGGRHLSTLQMYTLSRGKPTLMRSRSSSFPARPTKGRPVRSSSWPGASPTTTSAAAGSPSPNTAWVREACSWHAVHTAACCASTCSVARRSARVPSSATAADGAVDNAAAAPDAWSPPRAMACFRSSDSR